jgi:DNA repair protein RecO (recombination protein O)
MTVVERVEMESGFLLHARSYRETSQILEVFSQHHGRVGLVARGARRPKSRWSAVLQPFQPLRMSWSGRGSLYSLRAAEAATRTVPMAGMRVMAGFYLNELLLEFIRRGDPHPDLFAHYTVALAGLAGDDDVEVVLRRFEIVLLAEIGYGLNLECVAITEEPLQHSKRYRYVIEQGPVLVDDGRTGAMIFSGEELLAIGSGEFGHTHVRRCAKRLTRMVLHHHLNGRILKTRDVLAAMRL